MENAFKEVEKGVKWVLDNCTSYQVAKDLGINNRTVNRYQNGESPLENMTFGTAEKLYNYYLKERGKMKDYRILNKVYFNGKTLRHAGWSGGDIREQHLYKQFYVDVVDMGEDSDHYDVWWDLTEFMDEENRQVYDWEEPHAIYRDKESPETTLAYFEKMTPLNKKVEVDGKNITIINRPVPFAPSGGTMIYWAGAVDDDDNVYKVYWNIFNVIEPSKIEMTMDASKYCKKCLNNWTLNPTKCVDEAGHEFVESDK